MEELISTINEIVKYGLNPNLNDVNKEELLEKHLVKVYGTYFEISNESDDADYPIFKKSLFPNIRQNIEGNFPNFGFYKTVIDIYDFTSIVEYGTGDANDDLTDIIYDLLEVKWRIEHNSLKDGLWYFKFIFQEHTKQHILDLLNFMQSFKV